MESAPTISVEMPRHRRKGSDFGERLIALRKSRGFTQVDLAKAIGSTQRALSYYENEADFPPAPVVTALARALRVSTDELLGLKPGSRREEAASIEERRLWKKLRQVLGLPQRDRRAVVRVINSLVRNARA